MHFDDSLFEEGSEQQEKRLDVSQLKYTAKRCELNWFTEPRYDSCTDSSISDGDFMLIKFRADLEYFQKQYRQATVLYEATLRVVPLSNTVVTKEINESLARCRLHLGQPEMALEKAQLLVCPPHESDSSVWKLIADCHGAMVDSNTAAQVQALQKCASLQRYQFNYWTSLADVYGRLSEQYLTEMNTHGTCGGCQDHHSHINIEQRELSSILDNTVTLFRPYFSWLPLLKRHRRMLSHKEYVCEEENLSEPSNCTSSCVLSEFKSTDCSYTDVIVKTASQRELSVNFKPTSSLCLSHCVFTLLGSGQVHIQDWMSALERMISDGHYSQFARECVSSFLLMAKCSCLLWARQLLLYFVRYSHSFVKDAHERALSQLELQLHSCDTTMRSFLEKYFNKNRVFEESQSKNDKQ